MNVKIIEVGSVLTKKQVHVTWTQGNVTVVILVLRHVLCIRTEQNFLPVDIVLVAPLLDTTSFMATCRKCPIHLQCNSRGWRHFRNWNLVDKWHVRESHDSTTRRI
jgi:hypothetical protein